MRRRVLLRLRDVRRPRSKRDRRPRGLASLPAHGVSFGGDRFARGGVDGRVASLRRVSRANVDSSALRLAILRSIGNRSETARGVRESRSIRATPKRRRCMSIARRTTTSSSARGTAGCVLANRLSAERPPRACCCSKPGPRDRYLWIHIPIGYGEDDVPSPVYNWGFKTDPDPDMNNREIYWPRGRGLGGSSSINGLIYVRGQPEDYDGWAALGNAAGAGATCCPTSSAAGAQLARRERARTAADGPLACSDIPANARADGGDHRAARTSSACRAPTTSTAALQEGVGYYQLFTNNGWRCSTAVGYLQPARGAAQPRRRDRRAGHARACRRHARDRRRVPAGRREARGARRARGDAGRRRAAEPAAAAALGRRSARSCCRTLGIPVVQHLPGVGENLQDHLQLRLMYQVHEADHHQRRSRQLWRQR